MAESYKAPAAAQETRLRSGTLSGRKPTRFRFSPSAAVRADLARALGILEITSLSLSGEIRPVGRGDFRLTARLDARAVQACSVTLMPVPATVKDEVDRLYLADFVWPDADEAELAQDDQGEPLPEVIDLAEIAGEALALALPLYPRAPGAELGEFVAAPAGAEPMTDAALRPFAGLAGLAGALKKPALDSGE